MKKYLLISSLIFLTGCSYLPMKSFDLPINGQCPSREISLEPPHPGTNAMADPMNNPNINTYEASVQMCLDKPS